MYKRQGGDAAPTANSKMRLTTYQRGTFISLLHRHLMLSSLMLHQTCTLNLHLPKMKSHRRHPQQRHHQCRIKGNLQPRHLHNMLLKGMLLLRLMRKLDHPTRITSQGYPSLEWGTSTMRNQP